MINTHGLFDIQHSVMVKVSKETIPLLLIHVSAPRQRQLDVCLPASYFHSPEQTEKFSLETDKP